MTLADRLPPSGPDGPTRPSRGRRRAVTIRDVASTAAVSTATVSKFVNGGQRFSREVEDRIGRAIRDLGYSSNPMARGMITGMTGNVGIIILDIRNPHFTSMVKGASRVATEAGLNLVFADAAESRAPELGVVQSLCRRVDGLIVSSRLPQPVIDTLMAADTPVVFYGGPSPHPACHSVCCDNYLSAFMLGRHLRELGHRHVSYLGFSGARWSSERWRGLRDALEGSGATMTLHDAVLPSSEEGARLASSILLGEQAPDAVVAFNDLLALGVLAQARVLGIKVPDQVSIAGFDNVLYGQYAFPGLTSVDMMSEKIGELAMRRLMSVIAGTDEPIGFKDDVLQPSLVVRESTSAKRSGETPRGS